MKRFAGFAMLFCLFASFTYAQDAKTTTYFPMKKNSTWTYKSSQGEIVVKVVGTESVGGKTSWKLETTVNSKVAATELIEVREDGLYRQSINGQKAETPIKFLKLPPAKGDSWEFDFKVQTQAIKGKYEIKEEDVTVPAGTYKAAKLVEAKDIMVGADKVTTKNWFAENVGIVKIQFSFAGQESVLDLVKYEEGK